MNESYDLEAVYDQRIAPLMTKIITICLEHKMPMVASFMYGYKADEELRHTCESQLGWPGRMPEIYNKAMACILERPLVAAFTITSPKDPT